MTHSGGPSFAPGKITDAIVRSDDQFGVRIADGRRNTFDVASHYNFSPERLRLFANGSRLFPQYNDLTRFSEGPDYWALQPDAGDSMHIETAESGLYIVNYVSEISMAFQLNQELQDGDVLRFGPFNGTDGWVFEQRGADHDSLHGDIIEYREGTRTTLASDVELEQPTTQHHRYETGYNWYNVGNQLWTQTWTYQGNQFNTLFATTSNDGNRGPAVGNLNVWVEIEASATTTNLQLEQGSMGAIINGKPTSIVRDKPQAVEQTVAGTADAWEPIYAIRIDPDNDNVNAQLTSLDIAAYSKADTLELVAVNFHESKTDIADADWRESEYQHDYNSALQVTEAVSQVANTDGTVTDLAAGEKFGGHALAAARDVDGGAVEGSEQTSNPSRIEKKNILASDHTVILARTGSINGTLYWRWNADQFW